MTEIGSSRATCRAPRRRSPRSPRNPADAYILLGWGAYTGVELPPKLKAYVAAIGALPFVTAAKAAMIVMPSK